MNLFVCLVSRDSQPIRAAERKRYESASCYQGLHLRWVEGPTFAILLGSDDLGFGPAFAKWGRYAAVGIVRLDNPEEVARLAACEPNGLSHVDLVLRAVAHHAESCVPTLLGDFAWVTIDVPGQSIIAARDAFGVKKLYYTEHADYIAFASRAELLASGDQYNVQCLAELLAYCDPSPGLTVYAGVRELPAASIARSEGRGLSVHTFWSAREVAAAGFLRGGEAALAEECRRLHSTAVRLRLTGTHDTWANLSGGLDSSSVASMAQWLARKRVVKAGLAGTVSWVDSHGTGADEREYSDAVAQHYDLRNEKLLDYGCWRDDGIGPPLLDQPCGHLLFYARDRQLCAIIRRAGGRVLLTGWGGDQLFAGNMFFFADWVVTGRVPQAVREMARRAAIGRVSFWELSYRNAVLPLMPSRLLPLLIRDEGRMPTWIAPALVRRYALGTRAAAPRAYAGRVGHKYADAVTSMVEGIPITMADGVVEDSLDVRHPYLYRPLVEFALRLPPELCVRPQARKWVLREAMRGILPDTVRNRVGKGTTYGLLAHTVIAQRDRFEHMLRDPLLAQLGCIDVARLRKAFRAAQFQKDAREKMFSDVQYTLAIEAWLQIRAGRWPWGQHAQLEPQAVNITS